MRYFLVCFLAVLLCLSLCACDKNSAVNIPFFSGFFGGSGNNSAEENQNELYYEDGTLRCTRETDEETGETLETYYYPNGQVQSQSRINTLGVTVSNLEYTESGKLKSETAWNADGEKTSYCAYYENGQIQQKQQFADGEILQEESQCDEQGLELYYYLLDINTGYATETVCYPSGELKERNRYGLQGELQFSHRYAEDGRCIYFSYYNIENGAFVEVVAEDGQYLTILDTSVSDPNTVAEVRVYSENDLMQNFFRYNQLGGLACQADYYETGTIKKECRYNEYGYMTGYTTWTEQGDIIADCQISFGGNYFETRYDGDRLVSLMEYTPKGETDSVLLCGYEFREEGYGFVQKKITYISTKPNEYAACGAVWYDEYGKKVYEYQCAEGNTMYGAPELGYIQESSPDGNWTKKVTFYENTAVPHEVWEYENGWLTYAARYRSTGALDIQHEVQQPGNHLSVSSDWTLIIEFTETNGYVRYTKYSVTGTLLYDEFCATGAESSKGSLATKVVVHGGTSLRYLTYEPTAPGNLITVSCQYNLESWDSDEIWVWECNSQYKGLSRTIYNVQGYRKEEEVYNDTGRQIATWRLFNGRSQETERFSYTVSAPDHYMDFIYYGGYADRLVERDANGNEVNSVSIRHLEIRN